MPNEEQWYRIQNENEVLSPSLLVYPERIEHNIREMIRIAGTSSRLRPHVKTHKMPEIIRLQMKYGINKFKCATVAEAEMTASCGATDILLAMQPVGPNLERFFRLQREFPAANISCIADSERIIKQLSGIAVSYDMNVTVWLDVNNGMNRTGIMPGREAKRIYRLINSLPKLEAAGLHVYDGHIHEKDPQLRKKLCTGAFAPVQKMREDLIREGYPQVRVVAGGSPTFPVHALWQDAETSPGTVLLWDYGYSSSFSDMDFMHAAVLFTRVISKPAGDLLCLDLGHKAVASEMPQPRVVFPGLKDYTITGHNEEHMVIRTTGAEKMNPGDILYAIPWHICPTVDRHDAVYVVNESEVTGQWKIEARKRVITV